mgnify:CR=1 FL=1
MISASFSNIYSNFTAALMAKREGSEPNDQDMDFPNVEEGLRGVRFVHRCLESSKNDNEWVKF